MYEEREFCETHELWDDICADLHGFEPRKAPAWLIGKGVALKRWALDMETDGGLEKATRREISDARCSLDVALDRRKYGPLYRAIIELTHTARGEGLTPPISV